MTVRFIKVLVALVGLFLFTEICSYVFWKSHISPLRAKQLLAVSPYLDQFESRVGNFRNYEVFQRGPEEHDAGEILNDLVIWKRSHVEAEVSKTKAFQLRAYQRNLLQAAEQRWPFVLQPHQFALVDLSWMEQLLEYDHWNIDAKSPRSQHLFTNKGSVKNLPIPMLSEFRHLAKLRLLQSRSADEVAACVRELRHFAKLLISTEIVEGVLAANQILLDELYFINTYEATNPSMVPEDHVKIPVQVIDSFKNAVMLNLSMFHLSTPSEIFVNAYGIPGSHSQFASSVRTRRHGRALCAAINYNLRSTKYVEPLVGSINSGRFEHMRHIVKEAVPSCRIGLARAYWHQESEDVYLDFPALALLPAGRWAVGNFLASLYWPEFRPVERNLPRPIPATADSDLNQ